LRLLRRQKVFFFMIALLLSIMGHTTSLEPLAYKVELEGFEDQQLLKEFKARSTLETFKERPIYSLYALNKRISDDTGILRDILQEKGYFDAHITVTVHEHKDKGQDRHVIFTLTLGPRYKLAHFTLKFTPLPEQEIPCATDFTPSGIKVGQAIDAPKIIDSMAALNKRLANCGYPFAVIKQHEAFLDQQHKTVTILLTIDPGPFVRFGPVRIENKGSVINSFIENRLPFQQGDTYNEELLDQYRDRLSTTRLFESVIIEKASNEGTHGELPIDVRVKDAKHRTLYGGANYSTDFGLGGRVGWRHKNISGRADVLNCNFDYSNRKNLANLDYELPDLVAKNRTLYLSLERREEKTESYALQSYGIAGNIKQEFRKNWFYAYGLLVETARTNQQDIITHTHVVGVPLEFEIDTRSNKLDPKTGGQFKVSLTPEYGHIGSASSLVRTLFYGNYHFALDTKQHHVLAVWGRLGSTVGIRFNQLPADRRFYMGGGGSIRGYGHQLAGPLNANGKPIGGKSLLAYGVEPRFTLHDQWGAVVFAEGGILSRSGNLKVSDKSFYSVGAGIRYYTSFGPIRADIALPLKKRRKGDGKKIDQPFQLYISIGQAF
jgi:translocation and assembly module TamA